MSDDDDRTTTLFGYVMSSDRNITDFGCDGNDRTKILFCYAIISD